MTQKVIPSVPVLVVLTFVSWSRGATYLLFNPLGLSFLEYHATDLNSSVPLLVSFIWHADFEIYLRCWCISIVFLLIVN